SGGDFDLDDASNWVGDIASRAGGLSFVNNGDLAVGALTEIALDGSELNRVIGINNTGKVSIVTTKGNIALTENVHTSIGTADAIVLNAGLSASAGTAAGVSVTATDGVTVSTGSGGRAMI